jgi:FlaA1/EpsC-like NDP-sugar epimerase
MTIPEASQLVLCSGAMAKNGELFVLDMGKPVKIFDLAVNLIRLSGLEPYKDIDIVEIGLRPGEKLYEELLMNSDTLTKTPNSLIFIEKDDPITLKELEDKCHALDMACWSGDDEQVRQVLKAVVPTYRSPEEVNRAVSA